MERSLKIKSLWYLLISAFSFSYLILLERAGLSVPIFVIIQFVELYFLVPRKKPLLIFIPIFILSLNSFISASGIWRITNFFAAVLLYSVMELWITCDLSIKEEPSGFISPIIKNIFKPFKFFAIPFKCLSKIKGYTNMSVRILIGILIAIPCLAFILAMLSSADQIFSHHVLSFFSAIFENLNFSVIIKMLFGFVVGFYLFGLVYSMYQPKDQKIVDSKKRTGDLIILLILHVSILLIYTVFVSIQFKYLFAGRGDLPYGLTYMGYARQGFFQLIFLTGLNVFLILITIRLTKEKSGKWAGLIKISCGYLCAVTMILLISSFYRLWLYNMDSGLTRLRFLVFGFLIFEAIGLAFTFFYIIKPKFNIVAVYSLIGLIYYLILNVVPIDAVVAKNQIDRLTETGEADVKYAVTLSVDAASQISRLLQNDNQNIRELAQNYFKENREYYNNSPKYWRQWNLSVEAFKNIEVPEKFEESDMN